MLTTAAAGAALAVIDACSSRPAHPSPSTPEKVTYVTGFGATGREGFAWVAQAKGFFVEHGLDVTIVPGQAGDFNLSTLAAGRADFVEVDYSGVLIRAGAGKFGDFRVIASFNNNTLIAIDTLPGRGITRPGDLVGKTITQQTGAVIRRLFPAYAKLAGFRPDTVKWSDGTATELPQLLATGATQAVGLFLTGTPSLAAAANKQVEDIITFAFSEHMYDLYGNVLVTTAKIANQKPDLARRFSLALLRGLDWTVNNPAEAAQILHAAVPATAEVTASLEMTLLKPYVTPTGVFDFTKVAKGIALMESLGMIPGDLRPEDFITPILGTM